MSLSCPISYTRMKYPAKSIRCQHLQCFDALWFLHSQLQIPTWQCPVCQVAITFDRLAICQYVDDILHSCGEEVEQVELFADGSWKPYVEEEEEGSDRRDRKKSGKIPDVHKHCEGSGADTGDVGGSESVVVISLDSDDEEEGEEDVHKYSEDTMLTKGSNHLGGQSGVPESPYLGSHDQAINNPFYLKLILRMGRQSKTHFFRVINLYRHNLVEAHWKLRELLPR